MVKIRLQFAHFLCNGSAYLNIPHEAVLQWKMKKVLTDIFSELAWNISEFRLGFLITSCSFHFGVTVEFSETQGGNVTDGRTRLLEVWKRHKTIERSCQ